MEERRGEMCDAPLGELLLEHFEKPCASTCAHDIKKRGGRKIVASVCQKSFTV